ncbi:hypothetical protein C8Q77DRAFT_1076428 [Trametes polyzona]|nr:hypothetical protein C8Q77DRAFT_1076428 [Trametes polyzona]
MSNGRITFVKDCARVTLVFHYSETKPGVPHPINKILNTMLRWFKAYYATLELQPRQQDDDTPADAPGDSEDLGEPLPPKKRKILSYLTLGGRFSPPGSGSGQPAAPPDDPDAEGVPNAQLADKLQDHTAMYKLFGYYLDLDNFPRQKRGASFWPQGSEDKGKDKRLKRGYNPEGEPEGASTLADMPSGTLQSAKRPISDVDTPDMPSTLKRRRLDLPRGSETPA